MERRRSGRSGAEGSEGAPMGTSGVTAFMVTSPEARRHLFLSTLRQGAFIEVMPLREHLIVITVNVGVAVKEITKQCGAHPHAVVRLLEVERPCVVVDLEGDFWIAAFTRERMHDGGVVLHPGHQLRRQF